VLTSPGGQTLLRAKIHDSGLVSKTATRLISLTANAFIPSSMVFLYPCRLLLVLRELVVRVASNIFWRVVPLTPSTIAFVVARRIVVLCMPLRRFVVAKFHSGLVVVIVVSTTGS